jgi:hypothetical protein
VNIVAHAELLDREYSDPVAFGRQADDARPAAAHSMIEVEQHAGLAITQFGARPIGITAKQEAGKKTGTFIALTNFRERWTLLRKM